MPLDPDQVEQFRRLMKDDAVRPGGSPPPTGEDAT
jgi:hypothetical protein